MKDKKEQEVNQETKNTTKKAKKRLKWVVWISIIIVIELLILVFYLVKIGKHNYQKTVFFEKPKEEWYIAELKKPLMIHYHKIKWRLL